MIQVLHPTQSTSDTWVASGKDGTMMLTAHSGGVWSLQAQAPDGTWVDTGITFTANGIKAAFVMTAELRFRLHGGTAGAKAWVDGALSPGLVFE